MSLQLKVPWPSLLPLKGTLCGTEATDMGDCLQAQPLTRVVTEVYSRD